MAQLDYTEVVRLARKGLRAERVGKAIGKIAQVLLSSAVNVLLGGWMLMLAVGVIHDEWIRQLPTIGYWWAVLIVYLLRGVFSAPTRKDKTVKG